MMGIAKGRPAFLVLTGCISVGPEKAILNTNSAEINYQTSVHSAQAFGVVRTSAHLTKYTVHARYL